MSAAPDTPPPLLFPLYAATTDPPLIRYYFAEDQVGNYYFCDLEAKKWKYIPNVMLMNIWAGSPRGHSGHTNCFYGFMSCPMAAPDTPAPLLFPLYAATADPPLLRYYYAEDKMGNYYICDFEARKWEYIPNVMLMHIWTGFPTASSNDAPRGHNGHTNCFYGFVALSAIILFSYFRKIK